MHLPSKSVGGESFSPDTHPEWQKSYVIVSPQSRCRCAQNRTSCHGGGLDEADRLTTAKPQRDKETQAAIDISAIRDIDLL